MRDYLLAFVITGALTFVFSWVVWRVAMKFGLHPAIRERDVHKTPTPRLGGVAMFIGMLGFFVLSSQLPAFAIVWQEPAMVWSLLGAAALMVVVGVADDLWDLDWMIKLGAQFVAAWIVVSPGGIQIFYSASGQSADAIIERLVAKYGKEHEITVVTNDLLEQQTVTTFGAVAVGVESLRQMLEAAMGETARRLKELRKK